MPQIFEFTNLRTSQSVGMPTVEYPFADEGDTRHIIVSEPMAIYQEDYAPLPFSNITSSLQISQSFGNGTPLYHIGDENFQNAPNAPVLFFNRLWANIPQSRRVDRGSYAYSFPGINSAGATVGGSLKTFLTSNGSTHTTTTPHELVAGDFVLVFIRSRLNPEGYQIFQTDSRIVLSTPNSSSFVTSPVMMLPTFVSGNVRKLVKGRSAKSLVSSAIYEYDYYLPGVTPNVSSSADIRLPEEFIAIDIGTGEESDTVGLNTFPSLFDYQNLVTSGSYIVAEANISQYRGRILQREIINVRAK